MEETMKTDTKNKNEQKPTLKQKLEDASIDGSAIPFDPEEAEKLGAVADDMPLQDVIEAAHDDDV